MSFLLRGCVNRYCLLVLIFFSNIKAYNIIRLTSFESSALGNKFERLFDNIPIFKIGPHLPFVIPANYNNKTYDLLVISGGHGDYNALFHHDLNRCKLKNLVNEFRVKNIAFKNIIIDACLSMALMDIFTPALSANGVFIGKMCSGDASFSYQLFKKIKKSNLQDISISSLLEAKYNELFIKNMNDYGLYYKQSNKLYYCSTFVPMCKYETAEVFNIIKKYNNVPVFVNGLIS